MRKLILSLLLGLWLQSPAQGYISYDYMAASTLRNERGDRFGSGGMTITSAGYDIPIHSAPDNRGRPVMWTASVNGSYARLSLDGMATEMNPDRIINASAGITHLRPLSTKWSILAALGCGIYAPAGEISGRSILGNGGVIFICHVNNNLSLGIGGGVTNSFGVPMAMPMIYLSWQRDGRFRLQIDMSNSVKIAASTTLGKRWTIELAALDINGLTAVTRIYGKDQIYSMMMLRSYVMPTFAINDHLSLFGSVGGNWIRGISITERSLRGFFNSFKDDNEDDPYFQAALRLSTGVKFKF